MKVRCIDNFGCRKLTLGKIYTVINEKEEYYKVKNDAGIELLHYKNRFEIVKEENKMEKTFREVIATIKEGETWVNDIAPISYIRRREDGILDFNENEGINLFCTYTLQKKQYTFEEAFKAYEEGKEIESCENGYKYLQNTFTYPGNEQWLCFRNSEQMFTTDAIRGKWYIND